MGAAILAAGSWTVFPVSSAQADSSYEAFAQANGFELIIANPSIPAGLSIEGGGPQAQSRQSSIGTRDASAQFPYAGNTVPGLPGTGAALFGLPAPPYPFIAGATAGSGPQTVNYPGVGLHAESTDFATVATARVGEEGSFGARSASRIDESRNGDVIATASTTADSLRLGSYGSLSDVRSVATVAADGVSGELTRTTSTSIGRISVPGLNVVLPPQTPGTVPVPVPIPGVPNIEPLAFPPFPVPAGGETLADPDIAIQDGYFTVTEVVGGKKQTYILPTDSGLAAFKQAGIAITFQAPEETRGGIIAGTYRFTYTAPAPPPNTFYNGETRFTQTTALVVASVDLQPVNTSASAGGLAPAGAGAIDAATGLPVDTAALPGALPGASAAGVPNATPAGTLTLAPQSGSFLPAASEPGSGADDFLAVILIAGIGVLATGGLSFLGVRS